MGNICKGLKKDGMPCKAQPVRGKRYCACHDPERPEPPKAKPLSEEDIERHLAILRGETVLPDFQLEKIADMILEKMGEGINLYMKAKNENRK